MIYKQGSIELHRFETSLSNAVYENTPLTQTPIFFEYFVVFVIGRVNLGSVINIPFTILYN